MVEAMINTNNKQAHHRGFTLVELLIGVSIIGLLSSAVPASVSATKLKAKDAKVKAEGSSIHLALEEYSIENGGYPNPTPGSSTLWCIGASDCQIAGTTINDSTNSWVNGS